MSESWDLLHPSIKQLAFDMQYKLEKNAHKDTGWAADGVKREYQGWLPPKCPLSFLVKKLHEEVGELLELVTLAAQDDDADSYDLRMEAADVANLAMMLRDAATRYQEL